MDAERLRREIGFEAARLMAQRRETSFNQARWRAARAITRSRIPSDALPTDFEIRQALDQIISADARDKATDDSRQDQRYQHFLSLLLPLDRVRQDRDTHPEGDVLYHSLQVFELARERCPWDEDLLLAALLHDVGKGIDPQDHVAAGLAMLRGWVSDRVLWLIENHGLAQKAFEGTAGVRAKRRLSQAEDSEALDLLARCDREGRQPGRRVSTPEEALEWLRQLAEENEGLEDAKGIE
ncbi:MAG: HD domain-containing protein [Planctomycetota bacterium]